jgi:hypothetical protein
MDIPQQPIPTTEAVGELGGTPPAAEEAEAFELSRLEKTDIPPEDPAKHEARPRHSPAHEHHAHFDLPPGEPKESEESLQVPVIDIEHAPVDNDPREWSDKKKVSAAPIMSEMTPANASLKRQTIILAMIAIASISPTLGASIYNPAFDQLRDQLHATDTQLALSISIFILLQGGFPVCESAV